MTSHVSAGVYWKEIDLSNYIPALSTTQYGVVGTASKGPLNKRMLITTVEQLVLMFGYPGDSFPAIDAAMEYLANGTQLWFVRVCSEATPAIEATATATLLDNTSLPLTAKDPGTFYNGIEVLVSNGNAKNARYSTLGDGTATTTVVADLTGSNNFGPLVPGSVQILLNSVVVATDDGHGVLVEQGTTIFSAGTVNYDTGAVSVTWASAPTAGVSIDVNGMYYSTFNITFNKTISGTTYAIEAWKNLNLNPILANYYTKVLANSRIIALPTLSDFPKAGSYTFSAGTDGLTNITDSDYIGINLGTTVTGLQQLASPDTLDLNCFSIPGIYSEPVVQAALAVAEGRRDCIAIIDTPPNLPPQDVVDWVDGSGAYLGQNSINTSFAAVYYPWVQIYDSYNSVLRMVPPSGFVASAFALNDNVADIWYAPAGATRGKLLGVTGIERILEQGERDFLYQNRVNPVSDFIATGIMLWGQKTSQVASTSLDRVNARRTLNYIEKVLVTAMQPLVFEPNNKYTWNRAVALVQPYLDTLVNKGGLNAGKIVCDGTTNTPDIVDQNQMVANILLKLPKTAEEITLNFVLLSTGANINEYLGRQF